MAGDSGSAPALDATNRRIIHELVRDGRLSMRALAEKIHLSRAQAYVRVEQLREAGVIEGFTARIGYGPAGLRASAFVGLSIRQDSWRGIAQSLRTLPFVEHVFLLGGELDVLVLVRATDNATLRSVVLERLQALDGVRSTRTWLIFEESPGPGAEWM
ncbi:Lrp/AsnC family transcriptional regulator [Nocardia cyriacigeorgica]|uniref:Lrp/AsnC family transcriptional regulator n=1 Tax=Nocardia cyriacigeorgica TaxID=135487 RepID=A0A6P1CQE2_9NOCA|nr:Lrp/AsnC family transcriptional regulator [Nocardia cyriacigeorgica]MBF6095670.1 Lrp/AsnC family transcriptional regulator [Nocardia cyriacigeorgica]MBF6428496.1 Lrp/AsnC family transcriptional regulator [Nocardia cyriacigeorgica]NEW34117.1 Lrp/AsnC family transcriptional regulator [Nocardia cyriacigeorgica]